MSLQYDWMYIELESWRMRSQLLCARAMIYARCSLRAGVGDRARLVVGANRWGHCARLFMSASASIER